MKISLITLLFSLVLHAREADAPYSTYVPFSSGAPYLQVLAPDGQSFFTKIGKTVIQWRISPLKKMNVIKITEDKFAINMLITKDQKRVILQSYGGLTLWDLETKKLLKTIKEDIYTAVMNGSELITMNGITLTKWNSETLEKISTSQLSSDIPYHISSCYSSPSLLNDEESNTLVVVTFSCVFFTDNRTLENTKTIQMSKRYLHTSPDHKLLYAFVEDNQPVKIDTKTGKITTLPKDWIKENKKQLISYPRGLTFRPHSSFKSLCLVYKGAYRFYNNKSNKPIAYFNQFEDEEGLLMNYDGYFDASSPDKKYLKVKALSGKFVPINNRIYKKYHRKNILKTHVE